MIDRRKRKLAIIDALRRCEIYSEYQLSWLEQAAEIYNSSRLPFYIQAGPRGECFQNAEIVEEKHRLPLVAGFAATMTSLTPLPHSWNQVDCLRAIDTTWTYGPGTIYLGVTSDLRIEIIADMHETWKRKYEIVEHGRFLKLRRPPMISL